MCPKLILQARLKERQLRHFGWKLVRVSYADWARLRSEGAQADGAGGADGADGADGVGPQQKEHLAQMLREAGRDV